MNTVEILSAGLGLLRKGFVQRAYASKTSDSSGSCSVSDPEACCFCSMGALYKVLEAEDAFASIRHPVDTLTAAASELFPGVSGGSGNVIAINDRLGFDAAEKMYLRAIELAQVKEAEAQFEEDHLGVVKG